MMRPSVQGVDHPVCCVLDAVVTYARDSSCCLLGGEGRHTGTRLTVILQLYMPTSILCLISAKLHFDDPPTDILQ